MAGVASQVAPCVGKAVAHSMALQAAPCAGKAVSSHHSRLGEAFAHLALFRPQMHMQIGIPHCVACCVPNYILQAAGSRKTCVSTLARQIFYSHTCVWPLPTEQ